MTTWRELRTVLSVLSNDQLDKDITVEFPLVQGLKVLKGGVRICTEEHVILEAGDLIIFAE